MSLSQKVVILNKPLKLFGLTVKQWFQMIPITFIAYWLGSSMPPTWKVQNLPASFVVGIVIVCAGLVAIHMNEVRPNAWWINLFNYRIFKVMPEIYLPNTEPAPIYLDASIIDKKNQQNDEFYVQ